MCVSRPFQRTVTMHKDSSGHVGFIYKSGKITSLVQDGSAARNGLLTDHYICEINGQNVIGLKVRHFIKSFHSMGGVTDGLKQFIKWLSYVLLHNKEVIGVISQSSLKRHLSSEEKYRTSLMLFHVLSARFLGLNSHDGRL